jgi:hypothetical protein
MPCVWRLVTRHACEFAPTHGLRFTGRVHVAGGVLRRASRTRCDAEPAQQCHREHGGAQPVRQAAPAGPLLQPNRTHPRVGAPADEPCAGRLTADTSPGDALGVSWKPEHPPSHGLGTAASV